LCDLTYPFNASCPGSCECHKGDDLIIGNARGWFYDARRTEYIPNTHNKDKDEILHGHNDLTTKEQYTEAQRTVRGQKPHTARRSRQEVFDVFGVLQLYPPTTHSPQPWFMTACSSTRQSMQGSCSGTGSNCVRSGITDQVRQDVYAVDQNSFKSGSFKCSNTDKASAGFMQTSNDWRNVEMTGYIRRTGASSSTTNGASHFEWYSRSGSHSSSVQCAGCQGTALHANLYDTGRLKFEKELEHTGGYTSGDPENSNGFGSSLGNAGWFGYKAMFYNVGSSVKLEQWIDKGSSNTTSPGNNWQKKFEFTDNGSNWCTGSNVCSGTGKCQTISWGGPVSNFRSDNITWDLKWASVREIAV
jgi:hypothetical protein